MTPNRLQRARGVVLGVAVGDALGMPLDHLSHQNVRTYYRGVRGFVDDKKRKDLAAGQFTGRTQLFIEVLEALLNDDDLSTISGSGLRRVPSVAEVPGAGIVAASAIGLWGWMKEESPPMVAARVEELLARWRSTPGLIPAATGQAVAVLLSASEKWDEEDGIGLVTEAVRASERSIADVGGVSARLDRVRHHLASFPLDLQNVCGGGNRAADEAWPFALAMFARNPELVEAGLLSTVNCGGDAPTVGACLGALLGAGNGAGSFPEDWVNDVGRGEALKDLAGRVVGDSST